MSRKTANATPANLTPHNDRAQDFSTSHRFDQPSHHQARVYLILHLFQDHVRSFVLQIAWYGS
jgi:hypothetical protein